MFSVTVDDKEYKVKFRHFNPARLTQEEIKQVLEIGGKYGTDCRIYFGEREDFSSVGYGWTYLHPNDFHSYVKNFGRKEAMDRALHKAFPGGDNKETRRKFWQAYYEARGKKW